MFWTRVGCFQHGGQGAGSNMCRHKKLQRFRLEWCFCPISILWFILWFIRLAALLYILRRKRHRSIQRKKLYLRMSSVLQNTSILAIYGLWKSSEIVLLTKRSQYVYYCWEITRTTFVLVFIMPNGGNKDKNTTVRFSVRNCTHGCQIYYD
jgi:hypothetical protein